MGGGNTFFLLQELKRSGADRLLIREVEQGKLIVYTSTDSVLQICGNEETMGRETL